MLSTANAAQVGKLAAWGRGPVQQAERAGKDRVLALSTLGVYLYRESTAGLIAAFPGATGFLASPDGAQAALSYADGTQRLVSLESGESQHALETIIELSQYFCDTCSAEEKQTAVIDQHIRSTWTYSADGSLLATSFNSGDIGVWDTSSGELRWKLFREALGTADGLIFSRDNQSLISIGYKLNFWPRQDYIARWSLEDGKPVWYKFGYSHVKPELLSPDNNILGLYSAGNSGGTRGVISLYAMKDGAWMGNLGGTVAASPYSPDAEKLVLTYGRDVQVYQLQPKLTRLRTLWTKIDWPRADFSADGKTIVLNDGQAVYSAEDYRLVSEGAAPEPAAAPAPIFSPRGWMELQHLGAASGLEVQAGPGLPGPNLSVRGGRDLAWRWDPLSGVVQTVEFSAKTTWAPAFSPDRQQVAACTEAGLELRRFDSDETKNFGRCLPAGVLAFAPGGEILLQASGASFKSLHLPDGALLQNYVGQGDPIAWMEFSPDGALMASGGRKCTNACTGDQHLWKISPPGGVSLELDGSQWAVTDVVFSSDQSWMYSAKNAVWKWNAINGQLLGRVAGEGFRLALSPDDSLLAVGTTTGQVILISVDGNKELARLDGSGSAITALAFTPDGAGLILADGDGSVVLWGVSH